MESKIIYRQRGYDPDYKVWHANGQIMLIYMHSEGGSIVCKEKLYPIKKGVLCLMGAQKYHYTMPDAPERYDRTKLFLSAEEGRRLLALLPEKQLFEYLIYSEAFVYAHIRSEEEQTAVESLLGELCKSDMDGSYGTPLQFSAWLKLLVILDKNRLESLSSPSAPLHRAIELIHRRISEPLTVDSICQAIPLSKYYFCRQFKKLTGVTVMDYILRTRLLLAKNLLTCDSASVGEISERCGFSSISYFCKSFKEDTGLTPLQYRKTKS